MERRRRCARLPLALSSPFGIPCDIGSMRLRSQPPKASISTHTANVVRAVNAYRFAQHRLTAVKAEVMPRRKLPSRELVHSNAMGLAAVQIALRRSDA
jgi:hypothetical protein